MKSIVEEALAAAKEQESLARSVQPARHGGDNKIDNELEEMLRGLKTTVKIVGCGGGGCNTVSRVVEEGIAGADVFAANTDAQHLLGLNVPNKILLGRRATRGLGAGAVPQIGAEAAREAEDELRQRLSGTDILFVTCGLGGGTGTGSAPVIAGLGKELGALTIVFATTPFKGEGRSRMENAQYGLRQLQGVADTVISIPNDKLLEIAPNLSLTAAFKVADEVLMRSIKGLTEIITKPGLVNLDFNDLRTIMKGGGVAMMGLGESDSRKTEERAQDAIDEALNSPLIEVDVSTATGVLINVTGGPDMTISEAERVAEVVQERVSPKARIIWGTTIDPTLEKTLRVMVVLTGVKSKQILGRVVEIGKDSGMDLDSVR
jgi:cell division protein FtsZ